MASKPWSRLLIVCVDRGGLAVLPMELTLCFLQAGAESRARRRCVECENQQRGTVWLFFAFVVVFAKFTPGPEPY